MAHIYGAAGAHSAQQSISAFKKMFAMMFIVIGALCLGEGVLATVLLTRPTFTPWALLPVILFAAICIASLYSMRRVEEF